MSKEDYNKESVLQSLKRNPLIIIKGDVITCLPNNPDEGLIIGNKTRGKLSFLSRVYGYEIIWKSDN